MDKNTMFEKLLPIYGMELTDAQVQKLLNVSKCTLYRIRNRGEIKFKKRFSDGKNGTIVYNLLDLIDYMNID